MGQPVQPSIRLESYRWRDNAPDPTGVDAAFDGSDTAINTSVTDWESDTQIRLRILVVQTVDTAVNNTNMDTEFILQYDINAAVAWADVGAVGADVEGVQYIASAGFADNADTTTQLLGSGTQVTGDGLETAGASDTVTWSNEALSEVEMEFSIELVGANLTDADSITFRLLRSDGDEAPPGTVLNEADTNTPTITVNVAAPAGNPDLEWAASGGMPNQVPVLAPIEIVAL